MTSYADDYQRVEAAITYLQDHFQQQPTLFDLGEHLHLSEYHLQRLFQRWAGISPKRFLQYITAEYIREQLNGERPNLTVAYDAGLSGTGRLHDLMINVYAMTPGEYRQGGAGLAITYGVRPSLFGLCTIATTTRGICHLAFAEDPQTAIDDLVQRFPNASFRHDDDAVAPLARQVFKLQEGSIALHIKGTNFQIRVWEALLNIPTGKLASYDEIANAIGQPTASRAVGNAVGQNNIAYLIPCHRVIRKNGSLGGYHWGSRRKQIIIGWEAARSQVQPTTS